MTFPNGPEVRRRAAELTPRGLSYTPPSAGPHFTWLSDRTGIPVGALFNTTRDNPQPMSLLRVYDLAEHVCRTGEDPHEHVETLLAEVAVANGAVTMQQSPSESPSTWDFIGA